MIDQALRVLGVVAPEPRGPEGPDELRAEDPGELAARPLPVESVGAEQANPVPLHPGPFQLLQDDGNRQLPEIAPLDGIERLCRIVEGDRDPRLGPHESGQRLHAARSRQGVAQGFPDIRKRGKRVRRPDDPRPLRKSDLDLAVPAGDAGDERVHRRRLNGRLTARLKVQFGTTAECFPAPPATMR